MMRRPAAGFTLVELMVVVTIVGILSSVAIPKLQSVKRRATAAQVMGDFDVMRHAALSFYVDSGYFPAETKSGSLPASLKQYLPTSFAMKKPQWTLDYENWETKTQSKYTKTGIVIGVSMTTSDKALGQTVMTLIGNAPSYSVGSKYTFMISGF